MADFLRLSNRCVPACAKFLCGKCFCWGRANGDRPLDHDTAFSRCCSDFISFPVIQSFFCAWLLPANHVLFFRLLCPSSVTYCRTAKRADLVELKNTDGTVSTRSKSLPRMILSMWNTSKACSGQKKSFWTSFCRRKKKNAWNMRTRLCFPTIGRRHS